MTPPSNPPPPGLRLVAGAQEAPRHLKAYRRADGGTTLEWCEESDCRVGADGFAACGRLACPSCGQSHGALSASRAGDLAAGEQVACRCGHAWVPDTAVPAV